MSHDSRPETYEHIGVVRALLTHVVEEMLERALQHDASKLAQPELDMYDEFTPRLKHSTYGSEEYKGFLREMGPALQHHYEANRHHPEWGETGIEWKPIAGYEGYYEVSTFGDVRSVDRAVPRQGAQGDLRVAGQIMRAQPTPKGYLRVQLVRDGVRRNHMVHVLVAEAFIPNPEEKPEVNHDNGNKADNRVENLEWATPTENLQHAYDTGLKEPAVKYVVHCPELDLTTFGTEKMEKALRDRGYDSARSSGIWGAMDRGGKHLGLTFEGTLLAEWRRSRIKGMNLIDLVEMICDWVAASRRHADGDPERSVEINQERFGYSDDLKSILLNTVRLLEA